MRKRLITLTRRIALLVLLATVGYLGGAALSPESADVRAKAPCEENVCHEWEESETCVPYLPNQDPEQTGCKAYWKDDGNGELYLTCCTYECGKTCGNDD